MPRGRAGFTQVQVDGSISLFRLFQGTFPVTGKQIQGGQGPHPGKGLTQPLHKLLNQYRVHWHSLHLTLNMKQKGRDLPLGGFSGPGLPR